MVAAKTYPSLQQRTRTVAAAITRAHTRDASSSTTVSFFISPAAPIANPSRSPPSSDENSIVQPLAATTNIASTPPRKRNSSRQSITPGVHAKRIWEEDE